MELYLASISYDSKSAWIGHDAPTQYKILNGEFYYLTMVMPNPRKDYPVQVSLTKVSSDFKAQKLCAMKLPDSKIGIIRNIDFNSQYVYFQYQIFQGPVKMGVLDVNNCTFSSHDFNTIEGKSIYVFKQFVNPVNGSLYRFGGMTSETDDNKKFYIQKFDPAFGKEEVFQTYSIKDLPSYNLTGAIDVQWSKGSHFHDVVKPDIVNSMSLQNVFIDEAGNLIAVYELYTSTSWANNSGQRQYWATSREVVVASYDPNTLEENWRTIIPKIQEGEGSDAGFLAQRDDQYVGSVTYPFHDGVLVVYNDNPQNGRTPLSESDVESWSKPAESNIMGVYVNKNGEAKKVVLSHAKGENILPRRIDPLYPVGRLQELSVSPLIYAQDKKDVFIGVVE